MGPVADGGAREGGACGVVSIILCVVEQWVLDDKHVMMDAQGSCVVWHRGGVDGRLDDGLHFDQHPENGLAENSGDDFHIVRMRDETLSLHLPEEPTMAVAGALRLFVTLFFPVSICVIVVRIFIRTC